MLEKIWRRFAWLVYLAFLALFLLDLFKGIRYPELYAFLGVLALGNQAINELFNYKETRRKYYLITSIILFSGLLILFFVWNNNSIVTSEIDVNNPSIASEFNGYKIAHISDLHNKKFARDQENLLEKIRATSPDIIVITGDLVDRRKYNLYSAMVFVKGAIKIAPVYYVSGNHEAWSGDYENIKTSLVNAGVEIMDDRKIELKRGDSSIELLGLSDPAFLTESYMDGTNTSKLQTNLQGLKDDNVFQILLSHRPEIFPMYVEENMDLIFSGHAHGGQFRLPFLGGLVAPNQGLFPKYTSGAHREDDSTMIVSRGLGNSIIPIRIFNRPEIVLVTLKNQ